MPTILIVIVCIALSIGYMLYMKSRTAQQAEAVDNADFNIEFKKAGEYRREILDTELLFMKKAMGNDPIDAFNYANVETSVGGAILTGMKDKLKGMATLGTVKFTTVHTPKYLVLSGENLHILDTNTEGEIDNHYVFDRASLEKSRLEEYPLQGQEKAQAEARGKKVRAYKIILATEDKPVELIIYSCLIFTELPDMSTDPRSTVKHVVIANDFLKQLGDLYPNMKVNLPIFS